MMLFFQNADILSLVRDLGFPITTALLLGFFAWRNWLYTIKKIDEKDIIITQMINRNSEVSEKIIETQHEIGQMLDKLTTLVVEYHNGVKHND